MPVGNVNSYGLQSQVTRQRKRSHTVHGAQVTGMPEGGREERRPGIFKEKVKKKEGKIKPQHISRALGKVSLRGNAREECTGALLIQKSHQQRQRIP